MEESKDELAKIWSFIGSIREKAYQSIKERELRKLVKVGLAKNKLKKYLLDYFSYKEYDYTVCYNCYKSVDKDKNISANGWGLIVNYCNECGDERMKQIKSKNF